MVHLAIDFSYLRPTYVIHFPQKPNLILENSPNIIWKKNLSLLRQCMYCVDRQWKRIRDPHSGEFPDCSLIDFILFFFQKIVYYYEKPATVSYQWVPGCTAPSLTDQTVGQITSKTCSIKWLYIMLLAPLDF